MGYFLGIIFSIVVITTYRFWQPRVDAWLDRITPWLERNWLGLE